MTECENRLPEDMADMLWKFHEQGYSRCFMIQLITACSGMGMGEINALKEEDTAD